MRTDGKFIPRAIHSHNTFGIKLDCVRIYAFDYNTQYKYLKGLCNWFFFFMFRFKIVSREEEVEKKSKKINKSWRKMINRAVWTADMRSTAHRAADTYYYFPAPSE